MGHLLEVSLFETPYVCFQCYITTDLLGNWKIRKNKDFGLHSHLQRLLMQKREFPLMFLSGEPPWTE